MGNPDLNYGYKVRSIKNSNSLKDWLVLDPEAKECNLIQSIGSNFFETLSHAQIFFENLDNVLSKKLFFKHDFEFHAYFKENTSHDQYDDKAGFSVKGNYTLWGNEKQFDSLKVEYFSQSRVLMTGFSATLNGTELTGVNSSSGFDAFKNDPEKRVKATLDAIANYYK